MPEFVSHVLTTRHGQVAEALRSTLRCSVVEVDIPRVQLPLGEHFYVQLSSTVKRN